MDEMQICIEIFCYISINDSIVTKQISDFTQ
jgi:hypothetical protein